MTVPRDPDELRNWMVERWHQYGETFSVFNPDQQPAPDVWEPELPCCDDKGRSHPDALKHWQYLFPLKDFLRNRYAAHKILQGPSLVFDCLVRKFQKPVHRVWVQDQEGQPLAIEVKDDYTWYASAIRIGIFQWQVGFACQSVLCERNRCKLNRRNPDRFKLCDIYSIIQIFEACVPGKALAAVSKWFGVKLAPFESRGLRAHKEPMRYAVSKQAVRDLIARYGNMRRQHVDAFLQEARQLIEDSPVVPWHSRLFDGETAFFSLKIIKNLYRIKGPAVKAYLWLLIRQEETARSTRAAFRVSDADMTDGLGVSRTTTKEYRETLRALRLITVEEEKIGKTKRISITKVKY